MQLPSLTNLRLVSPSGWYHVRPLLPREIHTHDEQTGAQWRSPPGLRRLTAAIARLRCPAGGHTALLQTLGSSTSAIGRKQTRATCWLIWLRVGPQSGWREEVHCVAVCQVTRCTTEACLPETGAQGALARKQFYEVQRLLWALLKQKSGAAANSVKASVSFNLTSIETINVVVPNNATIGFCWRSCAAFSRQARNRAAKIKGQGAFAFMSSATTMAAPSSCGREVTSAHLVPGPNMPAFNRKELIAAAEKQLAEKQSNLQSTQ